MSDLSAKPPHRESGFALISTLSIMLLIVLLLVAILSMTANSSRTQKDGKAMVEAKANARLALRLALGDLQKQMGPDQRISANGEILGDPATTRTSVSHPYWTGVWDSWIAGDLSSAEVNSNYPSAESHHQTIGEQPDESMHPDYEKKDRHFREWLISLTPEEAVTLASASDLILDGRVFPDAADTAVRLVGKASLGSGAETSHFVNARLLDVTDPTEPSSISGRYGWWVGDESQKARLIQDADSVEGRDLSIAEKIYRQYAPSATGTKLITGLENVEEDELDRLVSFNTLNVLDGIADTPTEANFYHTTIYSKGVLADVREGGLKRDLNTLLEKRIDISDTATVEEYMLYEFDDPRFDSRDHSRVPIQDLSAYYQLYEDDPAFVEGRRGGVEFESNAIKVSAPDFGNNPGDRTAVENRYLREYTSLYRNPVPIRVQFVVGVFAEGITETERTNLGINPDLTHKLVTCITPVLTMWNPNNVTMTLKAGDAYSQVMKMTSPAFYLSWKKYRSSDGAIVTPAPVNFRYLTTGDDAWHNYTEIASMALSDKAEVNFEPGEVKIFSLPTSGGGLVDQPVYEPGNHGSGIQSAEPGWDPFGLQPMYHSGSSGEDVVLFGDKRRHFCFNGNDFITFGIYPEEKGGGRNVSNNSKAAGSFFNFWLQNKRYTRWAGSNSGENLINYMFTSTANGELSWSPVVNTDAIIPYNQALILKGFPDGQAILPEAKSESISGQALIQATINNEFIPLFQFTMTAASEVNGNQMLFNNAGRARPGRPFLHGSSIAPSFLDSVHSNELDTYNFGWEWQVEKINSMDSAPIQADGDKSFFGGGYTAEYGNTHVLQREIPTVPLISIASLSHAHLGGYSLGNEPAVEYNAMYTSYKRTLRDITRSQGYQRVTAHGFAGLAPHTLQAIGNSYAHPMVPAQRAFTPWIRTFDLDETQPQNMNKTEFPPDSWGGTYEVPCVDHSYLANKALWDEYFFSSIAPQPASFENPFFEGGGKTVRDVAEEFFIDGEPLPNHRLISYDEGYTEQEIGDLFDPSGDPLREGGPFDATASYMMVNGPFNVNSTSVEAWKVFLSSQRDKVIQYYDGASSLPREHTVTGTPVGLGGMANLDGFVVTSDTDDAKNEGQWRTWRSISDVEIDQLANAIVHQVKLRGPFLSLSEFVNRRLEPHDNDTKLSLKGALQAALDFEGKGDISEVTINKEFRSRSRSLDSEITPELLNDAKYPEALYGPAAYGSAPYVDQADLLRGFAGQLTPRGDTFVIRAYGDKLDSGGQVIARAWCEAVVQRTPEYIDHADDDYLAQVDLTSSANMKFGRRFKIVSFRWLNADEI